MPIYEYKCEQCAYQFELKRRFNEDGGSPCCPRCQGAAHRLFSPPAILFKGSGFYITDSRSDRNRPSEEGKTDEIVDGGKEETKIGKVEVGKKEEGKTDKVESSNTSESK